MPNAPVRYSPDVEHRRPDEDDVIGQLEEQFDSIQQTTAQDYGHGMRAVHAKAHAIARGTLTVNDDLPPEFAQGLFAKPGAYDAVLRISTNAGDILDDAIGLPRGLALKVIGVEGERLPGSEKDTTQDFILVDGPEFTAPNSAEFLKSLKLLAKTTDRGEGAKKLFSAVAQTVERGLEAVGMDSPRLHQMGGAPNRHPLGLTYYTKTAYRFGDHIAKLGLFPISDHLTTLTGDIVATSGRPDALRHAINEVLAAQGGRWELRAQLNVDLEKMPVEDPTVHWDDDLSPYVPVAVLELPPQLSWQPGVSERADDALSFNIWHGLAAHRPLGSINRARNETYRRSADFRGRTNGCPMHEPRVLADVP